MANPSLSIFAASGDGLARRYSSGTWSATRSAGSGDDCSSSATADYAVWAENTNPAIARSFYPFDLSSLPSGAVVQSAKLYIYVTAKGTASTSGTSANQSVTAVESTVSSTTSLAVSDYSLVGSTEWLDRTNALAGSATTFANFTTSAYNALTLNSTGVAAVNSAIGGYFKIALRSGYDLDNVAPNGNSNVQVRYSDYTGTSNDPYLYVEYSAPRTTSDSWAWRDEVTGVDTTISGAKTLKRTGQYDAWAWSDSAAPYWRAKLQPVLVAAEGGNTQINAGAGYTLPQATITVDSTTGFPSSGTFVISSSWNQEEVTYTGKTGTTFTGCSGGTGTYPDNSLVMTRDAESHFPQVVALDTTDTPQILVAYIQKPGHGGSIGGKIVAKISSNGGLTWGTQFTLQNFVNSPQYAGGGFVLQRLKNGRLLMLWYEGDVGTGSSGLVKTYISYSDDSGASWSTPDQLTSPFHANVCAVGFDGYLDTSGSANATYGDFYVTCYGNDTAAYDNTATYNRLMKVTDGGAGGTWTSVGTINTLAQNDGRGSEEASLTVLDNGTWVSHQRVEIDNPTYTTLDRYQCTSSDNGVTWTGHALIHDNLANAAVSHQMPEGHLITQGTDYAHGGQTITYFSTDRGTTWTDSAAYYRLEEEDATYSIGNGSDFVTIPSTLVPGRRVLNVIGQERSNQAGAQVKFQWYEVPNLPLSYDSWAWSDAATRTTAVARTTSDTWAWSDVEATTRVSRTASDTWAWYDTVLANSGSTYSRTTSDTWAWSDVATGTASAGPAPRTGADTWTWSDALARTIALSRTTSDLWRWTEPQTTPTAPLFWLRARRRTMSAPVKTYVQVIPKGTARTSSFVSPTYEARTEAGILVVLDVTSASGTGGLTLRINAHDQASSQSVPLNAAPTAVTAVGTTSYALYPFGAVAGNVTQATEFYLPRLFSISVTAGDSSSYTYSLGYCLLP